VENLGVIVDAVAVGNLPVRDAYDWLIFSCNVALAAIGVIGVCVAVSTLRKIERQTKATEIAAEAALQQAKDMVASERPFIMIDATGFEFVEIRATNRGKSPAQVVYYNSFPNLGTPLISEEWNPERHYGYGYDIDGMEIINIQWLAPGDSMVVGSYPLSALKRVTRKGGKRSELWPGGCTFGRL
jgi:hypothetical protein